MKFSLSTSFYNTKEYVHDIYNSLLSQTYKNWEWIVTDDFSDDSSMEILLEISKNDNRVKYIKQSFKQELYWNPHKFSSIDSHFIMMVDSDDIIYPKTLEIYKHFFLKYPDIFTIVSGGTKIKPQNKQWLGYYFSDVRWLNSSDERTIIKGQRYLINRCWRHIPYPTLNFNPDNKYNLRLNDFNILLILEEIGKIFSINRNLSDITERSNSLSMSKELSFNNIIVNKTRSDILSDTDKRRKNKKLYSFKKLFDDEFDFLICFFFNDNINKLTNFYTINILTEITHKQEEYLREIYFDFDINTHRNNMDYGYYIIQNDNDLKFLYDNINNININHDIILVNKYTNNFKEIKEKIINNKNMIYWRNFGDHIWIKIL